VIKEGYTLSLTIVTVVKDDYLGLQRTEASIRRQTLALKWLVITPLDSSATYHHVSALRLEGLITDFIPDNGVGIYPAMNLAIQGSPKNEWLWFLNAGDEFAVDNSAELVLRYVKESKVKWLYGGNKLGSSMGNILGENPSPLSFDPRNQLFAKKYVSHQSTIFENGFLKELGGFREHLKIAADWDLLVRASKVSPGQRIKETISVFYMGGLSTFSRKASNRELMALRKEHLEKKYFVKNYIWFAYREFRNFFTQSVEVKHPGMADKVRSRRLQLKNRFHR
jgi:hypothetical protein